MRKRVLSAGVTWVVVLLLVACQPQPPEGEIWAEVNGRPIYREAVEKQYARATEKFTEPVTEDQALARKLNILQELIQQDVLLQRAARVNLTVSDADINARLAEVRGSQPVPEFEQMIADQGLTLAELREEVRADLTVQRLLDHALENALEVSVQEMRDYYDKRTESFRLVEVHYRVASILVTPRASREIRNLGNNDARSPADARRKVQTLMDRLRAGEDFADLARQYSEDPVTALSGGDLGFFPESALQSSHPSLRSAVRRLQVGQWTGPITTPDGTMLVKLLEYEPPGQREFAEPSVQRSIRESLQRSKRALLEAAYIERARNQARVVNYLAREVLEARRVTP